MTEGVKSLIGLPLAAQVISDAMSQGQMCGDGDVYVFIVGGSNQAKSPNIIMLSHETGGFWLLNTPFGGQKEAFKCLRGSGFAYL